MAKLYAFGGSGEDARNCFGLEGQNGLILLDCGVKREVFADHVGEYPLLTPEIVAKIQAVFISHSHEDHTAALPLLYHLGYRGKLYASTETCAAVPGFLRKWVKFVQEKNGQLPYTEADMDALQFCPLEPCCKTSLAGITVEPGRSGHLPGSLWFQFTVDGQRFFYSGDIVRTPRLPLTDSPQPAEIALLDSAYAGRQFTTEQELHRLLVKTRATLAQGGKELLPVPVKGRSADLYLFLQENFPEVPLYVDKEIITFLKNLQAKATWVKPFNPKLHAANIISVDTDQQREAICARPEGAIILTQDGMLTARQGLVYFQHLQADSRNEVIISGHAALGTMGSLIFDPAYCNQNQIKIRKDHLTIKVHLDDNDVLAEVQELQAKKVVLFHSLLSHTTGLIQKLQAVGVEARCLKPGSFWEL